MPLKGYKPTEEHKEHLTESRRKRTDNILEKSNFWVGEKVKYRGIHMWITRKKGKPLRCEFCGKEKTTPRSIHWANVDHKYSRNLRDYLSLCVKCHSWYNVNIINQDLREKITVNS